MPVANNQNSWKICHLLLKLGSANTTAEQTCLCLQTVSLLVLCQAMIKLGELSSVILPFRFLVFVMEICLPLNFCPRLFCFLVMWHAPEIEIESYNLAVLLAVTVLMNNAREKSILLVSNSLQFLACSTVTFKLHLCSQACKHAWSIVLFKSTTLVGCGTTFTMYQALPEKKMS